MAPYEYRLCAEPHPDYQHAWIVTVWCRHYSTEPDKTGWHRMALAVINGQDWPHDPKKVWPLICRKLKV